MLYVLEDGTIRLTRGDTARLIVSITNDLDEGAYELGENDTLTLSVRTNLKSTSEMCFQKTSIGSTSIQIDPADTSGLEFKKYVYDVQLTTHSGEVYTIVEPTTFEILPEVTY